MFTNQKLLTFATIWSKPSPVTVALTSWQCSTLMIDTFSLIATIIITYTFVAILTPWPIKFLITLASTGKILAMSRTCFAEFLSCVSKIIIIDWCQSVCSMFVSICSTYDFWYRYQHTTRIDNCLTIHGPLAIIGVCNLCTWNRMGIVLENFVPSYHL